MDDARHLAALLSPDAARGTTLPSAACVDAWVEARLLEHGCARPGPGSDPEDPRVGLFWILKMAARTYARRRAPLAPLSPLEVARFEALLEARPPRDDAHGQLFIDPESALRRAHVILELLGQPGDAGSVLAVGDDDAVTVALAMLGAEGLAAVDIDERVLAFLAAAGARAGGAIEVTRVDVLNEAVPEALRRRFAVVVTDPFRDLDGGLGFLSYAAACLRRDDALSLSAGEGSLLWVDHPDWNFEHEEVRRSLEALGLVVTQTFEDLHEYPLTEEVVRPDEVSRALRLDLDWLREITHRTRAFSHLHVLRRQAPARR